MNNKKSMYIFLTLLPIIDLITSLITRFNLTTISLGIVVKSIFLLIMLYYLVIKSYSKHKKKSLIYISIIFLYIILYFLTKTKYLTPITLYEEIMYMFKLLYFPILLPCLLCYFDDKKFSKNELAKILLLNVITYGLLLFIPLLTNTNFKTYYSSLLGSSGWFYSGNEISIILILIFPFSYILLKRKKIYYILVPILLVFIISTIGTKASINFNPFSVKEYSTLGGISLYCTLLTTSAETNSFKLFVSIKSVIPSRSLLSALNLT